MLRRQACRSLNSNSAEQVPGQPSLGSEEVGKYKASENMIEQGDYVPAPATSRTQQLQPCGSGFRVQNKRHC